MANERPCECRFDGDRPLRLCKLHAMQAARLAEAERVIENAGCCLVMSNNGAREALTILRGYKQTADSADVLAITPLDCEHGCHVTRTGDDVCIHCGARTGSTVNEVRHD
jgi:hypothetical protein